MKIWQINSTEESMVIIPNEENDSDAIMRASEGVSIKRDWTPIKFKIYRKGKHRDFPDLIPGILVFTDKTAQIISELIEGNVEFLDTENEDPVMHICNVIKVIDCIDYDQSGPTYFPSSGRLSGFRKISFIPEKVKGVPIFKARENKTTKIYVSDEFRDLVLKSKLKGLQFTEIWDSEVNEDTLLQAEQKYKALLAEIEQKKGQEFDWNEAVKLVKLGMSVVSGKWKLQADASGNMLIGELKVDGAYLWEDPIFIPPILLNLQWHRVENSLM